MKASSYPSTYTHSINSNLLRVAGLSLIFLLSACGGGGGSGGGEPLRPPASRYDAQDTPTPSYLLKRANASLPAEALRFELMNVHGVFEIVQELLGPGVPVFEYENTQVTQSCDITGSYTLSVKANGAVLAFRFDDCQDDFGEDQLNGLFSIYLHDVDYRQRRYTITTEFLDYRASGGGISEQYSSISVASVALLEEGVVQFQTEVRGSIDSSEVGEAIGTNLSYSAELRPTRDPETGREIAFFSVSRVLGYLAFSGSGVLRVSQSGDSPTLQLDGLGGDSLFFQLYDGNYGFAWDDGETLLSAGASQWDLDDVSGSVSEDTPPMAKTDVKTVTVYADEVNDILLPLGELFFDPEVDLLSIEASVSCGPDNARYRVSADLPSQPYTLAFSADTFGYYLIEVTVRDAQGQQARSHYRVEYWQNRDSVDSPYIYCTLPPEPLS